MTTDQDGDDSGTLAESGSDTKKSRVVKGVARQPPDHYAQYDTDHYTVYDPKTGNVGTTVSGKFTSYAQYDQYTLYVNFGVTEADAIPSKGVRLDDLTAALVLNQCGPKMLHKNWPADFDLKGMPRATRVSLGHAAKIWRDEGEEDVDKNVVPSGAAGYYYMWWGGLHCLCGKEGLDAKVYLIRPSFEQFKCPGFGFKVSSRAIVQLASGDPADPTFASSTTITAPTASNAT